MNPKQVLIVDDEESILAILKNSLKKLGPGYEIATTPDGFTALDLISKQTFDLVITDYKMAGINGLELLETIRSMQPKTRVILMTAYGNGAIEEAANRLKVYQYLTKPLEIDVFRKIVIEALENIAESRPGLLILSDECYRHTNQYLVQLQNDIRARCIFLTDSDGHFIARVGDLHNLSLEQIASLVGGSVATLIEAGRLIDGNCDTINLAYREGSRENLFVINVGQQLLLIIVTEHGAYSSKLGSVWFYAQRTALALKEKLSQADSFSSTKLFEEDVSQELDNELDNLFRNSVNSGGGNSYSLQETSSTHYEKGSKSLDQAANDVPLLSFDEAIASGLLSNGLEGFDSVEEQ